MIIRGVLRLARCSKRAMPLASMGPLVRLYSAKEPVEYQAPSENSHDHFNSHSDGKILMSLILWPLGIWIVYDLLFVRRNPYSHKREFKLVCQSLESYICKKYMTKLIYTPYYRFLLKQSTPESQRAKRVFQSIIEENGLFPLKNWKVLVYDLPNMFVHLSLDKKLILSTKTLLLAQTDDQLAFLITHEIAHFLLDHNMIRLVKHWMNRRSALRNKKIALDSAESDFDKLAVINNMVCYYPSYRLLDKFNERDTDILMHSIIEGCKELDREKVGLVLY
eukprot:TRINITY_DN11797_c0_g1_i2.p1 TRINITY_DN11797_c0_g1~~TRINITY_DN11797_c0_g1_i2.p1  ORF type:complete len:278 (-),score=17.99 TRINITY_DN11797_c0_g1_i2:315-1148(-)